MDLKRIFTQKKHMMTILGSVFAFILMVFPAQAQDEASSGVAGIPTDQAIIDKGKALYNSACKSCHALDKKLVGPALAGVHERRDLEWLVKWINNAPKMIKEGDPIAVELYNEYKSEMTAFPTFSRDEILSILAYIQKGEVKNDVISTSTGGEVVVSSSTDDSTLAIVLTIVLVVLVLIILVLLLLSAVLMKQLKSSELDEADLELVNQKHNLIKVITHPAFIGALSIIAVLVGLVLGVEKGVYSIGVQQGYAPTQPIPFSHKIHAGEHEIDCNYCHTGVRKSKSANIPSPNICMNCHSEIKTESPHIQKIHKAIDYNVETKEYGTNTQPIEWVRIHNLPDLAYFNHQQHVAVGGIECETCHGPIKEMDVVYQYSPLTMGWCIDCHRNTEVNGKDNEYYDNLLRVHKEKNGERTPMTVENIGGLECSKCHY